MELWKRYRTVKKTVETMAEESQCLCGGVSCGSCGSSPIQEAQVTADFAWYVTAANAG